MRTCLALVAILAASSASFAHHSAAGFDVSQEILLTGTIANVRWANPHIYLTIETAGENKELLVQQVEVGPVAAVQTYGLTRDVVAQGSHVVIRANPSRQRGGIVRGLDVTTDSGAVYRLTSAGRSTRPPAAVTPADGLAGKWSAQPTFMAELGRTVSAWPLTEAGRAAPNLRASPRCDAVSPPPALGVVPGLRQITLGATTVVIRYDTDWGEVVRTIHMDVDHRPDVEPSRLGHSIGRWDRETLVIDSTGFADPPQGVTGVLFGGGAGRHVVERLTLTEDRMHLRYEFTLEDPRYLTDPVTHAMLWDHRPDLEPSGEACDPEIARRFLEEP